MDGVKRRVGSGMGVCQGSRCSFAIEQILREVRHGVPAAATPSSCSGKDAAGPKNAAMGA